MWPNITSKFYINIFILPKILYEKDRASVIFSIFGSAYLFLMNAGESLVGFFSDRTCSPLGSTCSKIAVLLDILKNIICSPFEQSQILQY